MGGGGGGALVVLVGLEGDPDANLFESWTRRRRWTPRHVATPRELLAEPPRRRVGLLVLEDGTAGPSACVALRQVGVAAPLLYLGPSSEPEYEASVLDAGADDFVARPCTASVLFARARALVRRATSTVAPEILTERSLRVDCAAREASLAGRCLPLSRTEFDLLVHLLRRKGRVVSLQEIVRDVLGTVGDPANARYHVSRLRAKLGQWGTRIKTVRGQGYRLD